MMKHSVILEYKRCRGCTTCIKNCPTEAIRVRSGKAKILNERCIDCGKCIQVCPHKAIRSVSDNLSALDPFQYRVALPDPALYGQFQHLDDIDIVLNGLLKIGFQAVYETAKELGLAALEESLRHNIEHLTDDLVYGDLERQSTGKMSNMAYGLELKAKQKMIQFFGAVQTVIAEGKKIEG